MEGGDTRWREKIQTTRDITFLELGEPTKKVIAFTQKPMANELLKFGFLIIKNKPD